MRPRWSPKPCGAQPLWIYSWHFRSYQVGDDEYASVNQQLDMHMGEAETDAGLTGCRAGVYRFPAGEHWRRLMPDRQAHARRRPGVSPV